MTRNEYFKKNIKKGLFLLLIIIVITSLLSCNKTLKGSTDIGNDMRIMSYNIKVTSKNDEAPYDWETRRELILNDIYKVEPDIIGFQEVNETQYSYLKRKLRGYKSIITNRDDNSPSESCPVFYSKSKFELISSKTFWLSETPDVMSKSWESKNNRVCTYVILKQKSTEEIIAFYNTHLDHVSAEARENGIKLILQELSINSYPSIVVGDFNCNINSNPYKIISQSLNDTCLIATNTMTGATFHNWGKSLDSKAIDFIFVTKDITSNKFCIINNKYNDVYASDHFPIFSEVKKD